MTITTLKPRIKNYKGYLGNEAIKKAGVQIEWPADGIEELAKCQEDPIYFAETYMYIITADGEREKIKLLPFQKEIIKSLQENRRTIVLTCRQAGKTTAVCAFILWYVLFQPKNSPKNVALLANDAKVARETLKRIQSSYELIPKWLQQGVVEWNKGSVELENGCRIFAGACTKTTFRGFTIQLMMIDEAAMVENWEDFFSSTYNTMSNSKKTKICLVSTPMGINHFHDFWVGAINEDATKRNGYIPIKVTWKDIPGRDEEWRLETLKASNYDYEKFAQEHECEFIGSSGTLIAGWKLKELMAQSFKPVAAQHGMYQMEQHKKGHRYVITCDVSRGRGLDYSTMQVIDVTAMPYKQVCTYRDNMVTPIDFAETVYRTARSYNDAAILIELNDLGEQVAMSIFYDYEYEHLLFTESAGVKGKRISVGFGKGRKDPGLTMTKTTKAVGCAILKLLIEANKLEIYDKETVKELNTFSRKLDTYKAEEGKNDDMVMPLVVFAWLTDQDYFKEFSEINTLAVLREKDEEQMIDELTPFGFYDDWGNEEIEEAPPPEPVYNWMGDPDS